MTEKITSNQESRISDLVRDAVRALGFSKDEAQEIIKAGGTLQKQVKPILQKLAMVDQLFGPAIMNVEFTVPADYAKRKGDKLEPSKSYRVRVFPIKRASRSDCLVFLKKQGAILVGHGEILNASRRLEWPVDEYIVYLDRENPHIFPPMDHHAHHP